jgi:hypothetical protein
MALRSEKLKKSHALKAWRVLRIGFGSKAVGLDNPS